MTLTRANVESVIVRRLGRLLTAAGLDGSTIVGTNADLNDPIGWAIRRAGGAVTSAVLVVDADVATIATADADLLFDLAELRALESAAQNYDAVTMKVGPRSENLSDLGTRLDAMIARKRKQIIDDYGIGLGTLEAGVITLDFMAQHEDSSE